MNKSIGKFRQGKLKNKNNNREMSNLIYALFDFMAFAVMIGMVLFVFYFYYHSEEQNELKTHICHYLDEGWVCMDVAGNPHDLIVPYSIKVSKGSTVAFVNELPANVTDKDYLMVRVSGMDTAIYVNDELRASYIIDDDIMPFRESYPSRNIYAPIYERDGGTSIRIELTGGKNTKAALVECRYGEKVAISESILKLDELKLIYAIGFRVYGILLIIFGGVIFYMSHRQLRVYYLGWCMFAIAVWNVTQSNYRDLLFNNLRAVAVIPVLASLAFAMLFALYFNSVQNYRHKKIYLSYILACFILYVVLIILQLIHISDIYSAINIVFGMIFVLIIINYYTIRKDRKEGLSKEYRLLTIGHNILTLSSIWQMITFFVDSNHVSPIPLCTGFLIMSSLALINTVRILVDRNSKIMAQKRSAEMRADFIASLSHEIRTPITAVIGINESILRECNDANVLRQASDVDEAGHLLLSLINDILDFSKLESGKMKILPVEYDVKKIIISAFNLVKGLGRDAGLDISLEVDDMLPLRLRGDEVRIQQIMVNLLTNAVKYTKEGSVTLKVFGTIIDADNIMLNIHVMDTGIGIKEEDQAKLFDAFTRVNEDETKHIEGTGLGLSIVSSIVSLMNGSIEVKSEYGIGSTFMVAIPQEVCSMETIGAITEYETSQHSRNKSTASVVAPGACILIVDDVSTNIKVFMSILKGTRIRVESARTADQALEMANAKSYDLIFMDHLMPGKDGIQALRDLRSMLDSPNVNTPVVMMTANYDEGIRESYMEMGFADYVCKPFQTSEIQRILTEYLNKSDTLQ